MQKNAPYADTPIPLSLASVTGLRYRTLNCLECGQPFLERNNDKMFRIGSNNQTLAAHVDASGHVSATCGRCTQKYTVTISFNIQPKRDGIPLYMQPQTIYVISEPAKKLRDTYCLECGKAFYSISDRIRSVVDNVVPFEMLDVTRLGPMEARCKFQHCKQRWSVMT